MLYMYRITDIAISVMLYTYSVTDIAIMKDHVVQQVSILVYKKKQLLIRLSQLMSVAEVLFQT